MKIYSRFLLKLTILTAAIAIAALVLMQTSYSNFIIPVFWYMLAGMVLLTALMHYSVLQISEKSASSFSSRFMMISGIKMMVYLIFITIYVFSFTTQAKIFLISFFILYLIFTLFEVFQIVIYLKRGK